MTEKIKQIRTEAREGQRTKEDGRGQIRLLTLSCPGGPVGIQGPRIARMIRSRNML